MRGVSVAMPDRDFELARGFKRIDADKDHEHYDSGRLASNFWAIDGTMAQNKQGQWVPAIPLPFFGMIRVKCACGAKFSNMEAYEGHYALRHILFPE